MRALVLAMSLLPTAGFAAQPVIGSSGNAQPLPVLQFEVDYAVAGKSEVVHVGVVVVDTLVSLGLPSSVSTPCRLQVVWFDWNGAQAGISGPFPLNPGQTLEFTTSNDRAAPMAYPPYQQNVFRNTSRPFEGYAQIRSDCVPEKGSLRVDAEFATMTVGSTTTFDFKPIRVTRPTGLVGD